MTDVIVAVFDTVAHANAAEMKLQEVGLSPSQIKRYRPGDQGAPSVSTGTSATDTTTSEEGHGGFFSWLFGSENEQTERTHYEEHATAGRTILSVHTVDQAQADRAMQVLERLDPVQLQEDGATASTATGLTETPALTGSVTSEPETTATAKAVPARATGPMGGSTEEVIALSEEQLNVGKRVVDQGTTRIRRYVTERPVAETIALRDETTTVERRRPTGQTTETGGAFTEKTVEVSSSREEPVVSKTAGVVEEVVVNKQVTERDQTIQDTVRKEEVEIDKPKP